MKKPETRKLYRDRIERVVRHLNGCFEAPPSLEELAEVAGISRFHFHRVYRAVTGETPSSTVRRLRIAKAAVLLRETDTPVTRIAFDIGYESSQAFAKAFRGLTGDSASSLRRQPGRLEAVIRQLAAPPGPSGGGELEVRLVSLEPFKVIASRHVGPHGELFQAFGRLFGWARTAGLADRLRGIYGVPIDDPAAVPDSKCRFDCCFDFGPAARADAEFRELMLGGGRYAVSRHVGPYEGLEHLSDRLYGPWLEASGFLLRDAPAFNHYLADPDTLPPERWETDIFVPVEAAG